MALDSQTLVGFPPIVNERSTVLVLGSFPSKESLRRHQYYGHPRNHFWPIMGHLLGIDEAWHYERRIEGLLDHGLAVWDVIASCQRVGSSDLAISNLVPNTLVDLIETHGRLKHIVFNGAKAEAVAKKFAPGLFNRIDSQRLPSTSPAHAVPLTKKLQSWSRLRAWLEDEA